MSPQSDQNGSTPRRPKRLNLPVLAAGGGAAGTLGVAAWASAAEMPGWLVFTLVASASALAVAILFAPTDAPTARIVTILHALMGKATEDPSQDPQTSDDHSSSRDSE